MNKIENRIEKLSNFYPTVLYGGKLVSWRFNISWKRREKKKEKGEETKDSFGEDVNGESISTVLGAINAFFDRTNILNALMLTYEDVYPTVKRQWP